MFGNGGLTHIAPSNKKFPISLSKHTCNKDIDAFCYACSKYQPPTDRRIISAKIERIDQECFGLKITYNNMQIIRKICAAFSKMLRRWYSSRHSKDMKYK